MSGCYGMGLNGTNIACLNVQESGSLPIVTAVVVNLDLY